MKVRGKRHFVMVEIECLSSQGMTGAANQLHGWIEKFGHTARLHGFEFVSTARLSPKSLSPERSTARSKED